jgi:hypothetical protein
VASSLLAWLGALDAPLAVVDDGDRLHPLLGRDDPTLLDALTKQLERQAPLTEAVAALVARIVGARELERFGNPQRICLKVNNPADLEHAERLLSGSDRPCTSHRIQPISRASSRSSGSARGLLPAIQHAIGAAVRSEA